MRANRRVKISKLSLRKRDGPDIAAPVLRMWHARGSKVPGRARRYGYRRKRAESETSGRRDRGKSRVANR